MNENGLNYIDLFAGAGGLSEGFIQSGYRPVAHVEMNEHAAKTIETRIAYYYLKDNGKIKSYYDYEKGKITREQLLEKIPKEELKTVINKEMSEASIKGIFNTIDDIKREKEIDKIDVIIGGPPCQAYSLVGRAQSSHMIVREFPYNIDISSIELNLSNNKVSDDCLWKTFLNQTLKARHNVAHGISFDNTMSIEEIKNTREKIVILEKLFAVLIFKYGIK